LKILKIEITDLLLVEFFSSKLLKKIRIKHAQQQQKQTNKIVSYEILYFRKKGNWQNMVLMFSFFEQEKKRTKRLSMEPLDWVAIVEKVNFVFDKNISQLMFCE
jgi:hypothetical protein